MLISAADGIPLNSSSFSCGWASDVEIKNFLWEKLLHPEH